MNVIERIDALCQKHNMSKYRLSLITGISQSAFSKIARQQSSLSVDTIYRICDAFGITIAQFFSEEEEFPDLSPEQKQLLNHWELLNPQKKDFAMKMIDELQKL